MHRCMYYEWQPTNISSIRVSSAVACGVVTLTYLCLLAVLRLGRASQPVYQGNVAKRHTRKVDHPREAIGSARLHGFVTVLEQVQQVGQRLGSLHSVSVGKKGERGCRCVGRVKSPCIGMRYNKKDYNSTLPMFRTEYQISASGGSPRLGQRLRDRKEQHGPPLLIPTDLPPRVPARFVTALPAALRNEVLASCAEG